MDEDKIKLLNKFIMKENITIDQYLELNKYVNIALFLDESNNKSYKIKIKNNLENKDIQDCLNKFEEFSMLNMAKKIAKINLNKLKNSNFYFENDLIKELPHFLMLDPKYDPLNLSEIIESKETPPKEFIKFKDDLTINNYLDFSLHIDHLLTENEYYVIIYDKAANILEYYSFSKQDLLKYEYAIKIAKEKNIFYASYINTSGKWEHK